MQSFSDHNLTTLGIAHRVLAAPGIPTLISPIDGTVTTGMSAPRVGVPTLSWEPLENATKYGIEISTSIGFASTIVSESTYATF